MKLGFIGFGNMAQALAEGFIYQKAIQPNEIYGCAKHTVQLINKMETKGFHACQNAHEVATNCDVIIIALKPAQVEEVISPIINDLQQKIVVSVATGWTYEKYENLLAVGTQHISVTPNLPVRVGKGILLCEDHHSIASETYPQLIDLFSVLGMVEFLPTSLQGIGATICGCGPAFISLFIETLGDAGVYHGLSAELAESMATYMLNGTSQLMLETNRTAQQMRQSVCVPGGTTITGIAMLEKKGFRAAILEAIDAVEYKRHHHDQ